MDLGWGASTNTGKVRKANQDRVFADGKIFIVADGMGGANGGETASQVAVDTFVANLERSMDRVSSELIMEAVAGANSAVYDQGMANAHLHGMGTTFVSLIRANLDGHDRTFLLNVGDSRGYVYRAGDITQLTQDHSWVGEMFRAGMLSAEDIATSKSRHVLTRAVGVDSAIEADLWDFDAVKGDRVLLCSDGITNELNDHELGAILGLDLSAQEVADKVVDAAVKAGGFDNASAVVVDFGEINPISAQQTREPGAIQTHGIVRIQPALTPISTSSNNGTGAVLQSIPVPLARGDFRKAGKILRVASFLVVLGLIIAIGVLAIRKYLGSSYYVGVSANDHVAVYQGRPGGLLWFTPRLVSSNDLIASSLPKSFVSDLKRGVEESNLAAANTYVRNLQAVVAQFKSTTVTTVPTTTTVPIPTTVQSSTTTTLLVGASG